MYLDTLLYTFLIADSDLTDLLDTDSESDPAIFNDYRLPATFTGNKSINFYNNEPFDGTKKVYVENYILNCRAADMVVSQGIAKQLHLTLNRIGLDSYSLAKTNILPTIPPEDETDVYNTPVQLKLINTEV